MFGMLSVFGEFERELIRERVSPGDVRALRASEVAKTAKGEAFFTERDKRASRSAAYSAPVLSRCWRPTWAGSVSSSTATGTSSVIAQALNN